ncbi:hypothetical protein ACFWVP_16830 [Streptomyces sp. NPDC058637]|uniref:hypothetical protein n=1 Tax=Streptomyces sp. NPDC058637 TaxID=3346569 RepID=UPI0036600064
MLTSDGAVLTLVRSRSAPPAPVLHDVSDQVADNLDPRTSRRTTASAVATFLTLIAALLARPERSQGEPFASQAVRGLRRIVSSWAARKVAGITRADPALGSLLLRPGTRPLRRRLPATCAGGPRHSSAT